MKHGKKYTEAAKQVDRAVAYEPADAVALAKKTAVAKFDETIEVHIRTGCDGRHAEQQIRGAVVLPNGTGKTVKVLVFAKGDKVNEAEAAGADLYSSWKNRQRCTDSNVGRVSYGNRAGRKSCIGKDEAEINHVSLSWLYGRTVLRSTVLLSMTDGGADERKSDF